MKVHGGREYVCDFCGIGYSIQEYLDGHKQYVHPVCEQCHRQFITCPELEEHMRNHQELVRIKRGWCLTFLLAVLTVANLISPYLCRAQ